MSATITITLPNDLKTDFLDWLGDEGHTQFRRFLREGERVENALHTHVECNFDTSSVVVTSEIVGRRGTFVSQWDGSSELRTDCVVGEDDRLDIETDEGPLDANELTDEWVEIDGVTYDVEADEDEGTYWLGSPRAQ